jgi:RimJ/RimL family protein N-acetyltransferase
MNNNSLAGFPPLPQKVESERLLIRPSNRTDAPYLKKWWNDPTVTAPAGNVAGMQYEDEDVEDWFRRYVDGRTCASHFIICLRVALNQPIGEFYIASDDRPGSVGIAVLIGETSYWQKGYASEAVTAYAQALFDSGQCEAVRLDTRRDNLAAIRMCLRIGCDVEYVWANGQFQTMLLTPDTLRQARSKQAQSFR